MPWNKPGNNNSDNQNPWGNKQPGPPNLDKLLRDFFNKITAHFKLDFKKSNWQFSGDEHHYGFILGVLALAVFVVWVFAGIYIVNPAEQAVILRFGQYSDVVQPGLHWMARFIDTKYLVDVQKIYSFSLQGDFLTKSSEQSDLPNKYIDAGKKLIETSDQSKNLVNVELNVQYRIGDPRAYLFNIVNPDDTVQQVASSALSDVIGQMKLDDVLTTGRESLSFGVLERSKQIMQNYNSGLEVVAVTLKKVQSPDQVREAFNDVNRADQDKATYIQQAQAYASKVVPIAQGMAARTLADANGYQQQIVLSAEAQVAKYQALFNAYKAAPEVTRERLYLETVQQILESTTKILVESNGGNNLLYLPLDKLLKQNDDESQTQAPNDKVPTPQLVTLSAPNGNTVGGDRNAN